MSTITKPTVPIRHALLLLCLLVAPAAAQPNFFDLPETPTGDALSLGGVIQFRYNANFQRDPAATGPATDEETLGFEFRRLRLRFRGTAAEGRVNFFIQPSLEDGTVENLDAFVDLGITEDLTLRFGQFKTPFNYEALVSNFRLLGLERPATSVTINPHPSNRTDGVLLTYVFSEKARLTGGYTGGSEGLNNLFNAEEDGEALVARFEFTPIGELRQFRTMFAPPGTPTGLQLGAAVHYETRDAGGDRFAWTSDVTFRHDRFAMNVTAGGHVAEDLTLLDDPQPEHAFGTNITAGYFVTEDFQPFARYEFGTTSDDDHPDLHIALVGFHYFILGNALRFSADAGYSFEGVGPVFDRTSDNLLLDTEGDDGQLFIRAQMQVLF